MKKLVTIILFFLTSQNFYSQEWELVVTSISGDQFYMKKEKVNTYGNLKVWVKGLFKNTYYLKGNQKIPVSNAKQLTLYEFNCSEKTFRAISYVLYDSKGAVLDTFEFNYEMHNPVPDSISEELLNFTCKNIQ